MSEYKIMADAALNVGVTPVQLKEIRALPAATQPANQHLVEKNSRFARDVLPELRKQVRLALG